MQGIPTKAGRTLLALLWLGAGIACEDPADAEPPANEPPPIELTIVSPPAGAALSVTSAVVLQATAQASDIGALPDDSVFWTVDGAPLPPGRTHTIRLDAGQHVLEVEARWGERTSQASRTVHVEGVPVGSVLWRGIWEDEGSFLGRGGISAGVDGTLYAHDRFGIFAFEPDGSERWLHTSPGTGFEHPPTVLEDGSVVIGTEFGVKAVGPDGTMRWEYQLEDRPGLEHVHGGVSVGADGTIYFGTENTNGVVIALWPDGRERWVSLVQPADTPAWRFFGAPVIVGDTLVVLVTTNRSMVAGVDARTGEVKWRVDMRLDGVPIPVAAPVAPAVADNGDAVIALLTSLIRLDPAGQIVWQIDYYGPFGGAPASPNALAISGGRIYAPTGSGGIDIYEADGTYVARYGPAGSNWIEGGVTLGRGNVAYVLHRDTLRSYAPDGTLRYATHIGGQAGSGQFYIQVPVIGADGTVYVRSLEGGVVAVADTVGPSANAEWPTMGGGNRRLGWRH